MQLIGYQKAFPSSSFLWGSSPVAKKIKCVYRRRLNIQYGKDINIPKGSKKELSGIRWPPSRSNS